jgi:hypothetical protein
MLVIDTENFPKELYPLAWLVGEWSGEGRAAYPDFIEDTEIKSEVIFEANIKNPEDPFLSYKNTVTIDKKTFITETGEWRLAKERPEALTDESTFPLTITMTNSLGFDTEYVGIIGNGKCEILSDKIHIHEKAELPKVKDLIKQPLPLDIYRSKRMYGYVQGKLFWLQEIGVIGNDLGSFLSVEMGSN